MVQDGAGKRQDGHPYGPGGHKRGPSWPQEGSKRAQDGSKGAPRGPKLAPRWLQEGPRWPTWLREFSRTLPGPPLTPPGSDFGTQFGSKTDPRRPKSLRKLYLSLGLFLTLEPLHWASQVTSLPRFSGIKRRYLCQWTLFVDYRWQGRIDIKGY